MNYELKKSAWSWVPSLYFAEGIPYVAVMTIALILYKQLGLSNAEITFYTSWLYLPWVIKPLWSPFIDLIKTKRWWITSMQLLIGAAFGGVAFTIPTSFWLQGTLCFFWLMAFSSATHDISADGFYMLGLSQHDQTWFVGIRSTFYRFAMIFGQGVLVMIAGNLQVVFRNNITYSWSLLFYGIMGMFLALWLWHSYILPRPAEDAPRKGVTYNTIFSDFIATLKTFFQKEQVIVGILFMLLYRMPEGLLAKVSSLFLIDAAHNGGLGLSPQEYGLVQGTVGVIGLTLGGILGGMVASRDGLKKWLWPMVCAITLPDIVYVYLSYAMPSNLLIINVCIFFEQFGYGFGFTAYMLYLIYYSRGEYKTSHYALCTAFMALSMMIPGLFAGALQELVGYRTFFIIVMAFCSVTFITASLLKINPEFGKKTNNEDNDIIKNEDTDADIINSLPAMAREALSKMSAEQQAMFLEEYNRKKKSVGLAYLFLIFILGMPYGYLGKWGYQIIYWVTGAGCIIWGIYLLFKLPEIVRDYNKDVAIQVIRDLKILGS